jgi:hypothetical protein
MTEKGNEGGRLRDHPQSSVVVSDQLNFRSPNLLVSFLGAGPIQIRGRTNRRICTGCGEWILAELVKDGICLKCRRQGART